MAALAEALDAPAPKPRGRRRSGRLLGGAIVAGALAAGAFAAHQLGIPRRLDGALRPAGRAAQALVEDVREAVAPERKPKPGPSSSETTSRTPASIPHAAPTARTSTKPQPRPAAAAAPRPPKVALHVRTTPPGATVVRLDTRERLGKTPLAVDVARRAAQAWIELRLDGYAPVRFAVDLRKDSSANVSLRRAKKKTARRR
jgi:hypothetical protein